MVCRKIRRENVGREMSCRANIHTRLGVRHDVGENERLGKRQRQGIRYDFPCRDRLEPRSALDVVTTSTSTTVTTSGRDGKRKTTTTTTSSGSDSTKGKEESPTQTQSMTSTVDSRSAL